MLLCVECCNYSLFTYYSYYLFLTMFNVNKDEIFLNDQLCYETNLKGNKNTGYVRCFTYKRFTKWIFVLELV
jgi:hypothetical protein